MIMRMVNLWGWWWICDNDEDDDDSDDDNGENDEDSDADIVMQADWPLELWTMTGGLIYIFFCICVGQ